MSDELRVSAVVVDRRVFEVTAHHRSSRSMVLTVVVDAREQWSFDVSSWRGWSCGASPGLFYVWAARQLISFPERSQDPVELAVDEDLLFVFRIDDAWLVVCETSVRLMAGQRELARVECGDVVESAHWETGRLLVVDDSGSRLAVTVTAGALTSEVVE
ncbi:MAG: hypothetical protein ACTHNT_06775 [Actinomycetales bacterium]